MFNTNQANKVDTNIKINAVSGMIVKNHPKSFFLRFHMNSKMAETLFKPTPRYDYQDAIVLQILLLANDQFLAEIVLVKDMEGEQ